MNLLNGTDVDDLKLWLASDPDYAARMELASKR